MGKEDQEGLERDLAGNILTSGTEGAGAAGTEGTQAAKVEDPEFELEFGEEGKKEKKKVKLSELHKGYMLNTDYTKKTQDLTEEKSKHQDLIDWSETIKKNDVATKIILALSTKGLSNPALLTKTLAVLEAVEGKKEEVTDEIATMEAEVANLDPDSAEAKTMKRLITFSKGLLTRMTKAEEDLKTASASTTAIRTDQEKRDSKVLLAQAEKVLTNTLSALCDAEKEGGLKFESDEAKGLWRQLVISHLKDNPKEYKDEKDFVSTIQEAGKKYHSTLQKYGENVVATYLKGKKTPIPPAGGPGGDEIPKDITFENLQEGLEKMLTEQEASKK